jgi:hypothetical protein
MVDSFVATHQPDFAFEGILSLVCGVAAESPRKTHFLSSAVAPWQLLRTDSPYWILLCHKTILSSSLTTLTPTKVIWWSATRERKQPEPVLDPSGEESISGFKAIPHLTRPGGCGLRKTVLRTVCWFNSKRIASSFVLTPCFGRPICVVFEKAEVAKVIGDVQKINV